MFTVIVGNHRKLCDSIVWALLIVFIFLAGDPLWIIREATRRDAERQARIIREGHPAHQGILDEMESILELAKEEEQTGLLSPQKVAEYQFRVITLSERIDCDHGDMSKALVDGGERTYIHNVRKVPPSAIERQEDPHPLKPREPLIHLEYRRDLMAAQDKVWANERAYQGPGVGKIGRWVIKWYYLFTIPTLLIILINLHLAGASVLARLIIEPWRVLLACMCGPFGVLCISDSAFQYRRFLFLREQLLRKREYGARLTEQEENALWVQVNRPVLEFEHAFHLVQSGSVAVSKPLLASLLIWLGSAYVGSHVLVLPPPTAIHAVYTGGDVWLSYSGDTISYSPPLACSYWWDVAIISTLTVIRDCARVTLKPHVRSKRIARGPPSAVEERRMSGDPNNLLNCSMQKRRLL